jgi:imidazolonepropionase-like amidohydrolase
VPRFTREVATPDEARRAVAALLPQHPDVLKIAVDHIPLESPRMTPEVIAAIVVAGHASGVRSVAHIGRSADALDAVRGGVDGLLHGVYLEEISDEAVAALAAAHVPVAVTIAVFDTLERFLPDHPVELLPIEKEIARPDTVTALSPIPDSFDRRPMDPFIRAVAAAHDARRANVRKLRAAGVTILAGSDSPNIGHFPGAGLHVELTKLVDAGMSPGEALRAATWDNARFVAGPKADFGVILSGKRANLVLVDGDPVADITATGRIARVFLDGVELQRHPR